VPDHDLGVGRSGGMGEEARARRERHPGLGAAQVLEQEWHAGQRGVPIVRRRRSPGLIVDLGDHGVEGRVQRLDPEDRRLEHLLGRDLASQDQRGKAEPVIVLVVLKSAHTGWSSPRFPTASYHATSPAARRHPAWRRERWS
jgi:hypothetical protein